MRRFHLGDRQRPALWTPPPIWHWLQTQNTTINIHKHEHCLVSGVNACSSLPLLSPAPPPPHPQSAPPIINPQKTKQPLQLRKKLLNFLWIWKHIYILALKPLLLLCLREYEYAPLTSPYRASGRKNEEVRAKIQQAIGPHEDLLMIVKRRKLQWCGHVSHSSGLTKTILQGTVKRGRRQGRQRKRWADNIREWTGLEFTKYQGVVENRDKWRKLVAKSSVVPQRPWRLRAR